MTGNRKITIVVVMVVACTAFMSTALTQQYVSALQWRTQEEIKAEYYQAMREQFAYMLQHNGEVSPEITQKVVNLFNEYLATLPREEAAAIEQQMMQEAARLRPQQQQTTVDDGYTYPKNATEEEKARIDSQERYEWEQAGRPGEEAAANPYCDLLSSTERQNVTCHDRRDVSDVTGLYTCNDGTHEEDWRDCKDVSGYDYAGESVTFETLLNLMPTTLLNITNIKPNITVNTNSTELSCSNPLHLDSGEPFCPDYL